MTLRNLLLCAGICAALASNPAFAATNTTSINPTGPPQASFYEVTESMRLLMERTSTARVATSALSGNAAVDTPFCPKELAANITTPTGCTLVAIGKDDVSLKTGLGTFQATLDVVVQGDNPVDAPEFVVDEIRVSGKMDFSPAILDGLPYGTVHGHLVYRSLQRKGPAFIGVFRLPFNVAGARAFVCGATPTPNPNFGADKDYVYLDTTALGAPTGRCIDIRPEELSLGVPTVRFDIWFE